MQVFEDERFGTVRIVVIDDEPWFVGKDVAVILGYKNPQEAIRNHVDEEDKGVSKILPPRRKSEYAYYQRIWPLQSYLRKLPPEGKGFQALGCVGSIARPSQNRNLYNKAYEPVRHSRRHCRSRKRIVILYRHGRAVLLSKIIQATLSKIILITVKHEYHVFLIHISL